MKKQVSSQELMTGTLSLVVLWDVADSPQPTNNFRGKKKRSKRKGAFPLQPANAHTVTISLSLAPEV